MSSGRNAPKRCSPGYELEMCKIPTVKGEDLPSLAVKDDVGYVLIPVEGTGYGWIGTQASRRPLLLKPAKYKIRSRSHGNHDR